MPPPTCSYTVTMLHKCLSFGNAASARKWDLSSSNEALFWFKLALSIDHHNVEALIGQPLSISISCHNHGGTTTCA